MSSARRALTKLSLLSLCAVSLAAYRPIKIRNVRSRNFKQKFSFSKFNDLRQWGLRFDRFTGMAAALDCLYKFKNDERILNALIINCLNDLSYCFYQRGEICQLSTFVSFLKSVINSGRNCCIRIYAFSILF